MNWPSERERDLCRYGTSAEQTDGQIPAEKKEADTDWPARSCVVPRDTALLVTLVLSLTDHTVRRYVSVT